MGSPKPKEVWRRASRAPDPLYRDLCVVMPAPWGALGVVLCPIEDQRPARGVTWRPGSERHYERFAQQPGQKWKWDVNDGLSRSPAHAARFAEGEGELRYACWVSEACWVIRLPSGRDLIMPIQKLKERGALLG